MKKSGKGRRRRVNAAAGDTARSAVSDATRLLALRPRTTKELREKLLGRGYGPEEIERALERLIEGNWLDDEAFARNFVRSKMENRRWGGIKISHELKRKGVPSEIIEKVLGELEQGAEENAAKEALKRWLKKSGRRHVTGDIVERAARHLMGKGFSFPTIRPLIKGPCPSFAEEE